MILFINLDSFDQTADQKFSNAESGKLNKPL